MKGSPILIGVGIIAVCLLVFSQLHAVYSTQRNALEKTKSDLAKIAARVDSAEKSIAAMQSNPHSSPPSKVKGDESREKKPPASVPAQSASNPRAEAKDKKPVSVPASSQFVYASPLSRQEQQFFDSCMADHKGMDWDGFAGPDGKYGEVRHDHPALGPEKTCIELGGNIGVDAKEIALRYKPSLHLFEPIPYLCDRLIDMFANFSDVHIHCYGVSGNETRTATFYLRDDPTHSQGDAGEFDPKSDQSEFKPVRVKIRAWDLVMQDLGLGVGDLHTLHINCEGCEYEVLEHLQENGDAARIEEIHLAWHPLDRITDYKMRYCRMRALFARTHKLVYSFRFNWEMWLRKDLANKSN